MKCLLLEDNIQIGRGLRSFLLRNNIDCTLTTTTQSFLAKLREGDSNDFSVILMDYNISGSTTPMEVIIQHIRNIKSFSRIPILCYSGTFDVAVRVLNAGADDMMFLNKQKRNIELIENNQYLLDVESADNKLDSVAPAILLEKPVNKKSMQELVSRIWALVRRTLGNATNEIQIKYLNYNLVTKIFRINNREVNFSKKERSVLEVLIQSYGGYCTRETCMKKIYATPGMVDSFVPDNKIIDVFICRIKKKIKDAFELEYPNTTFSRDDEIIITVWGLGYRIVGNQKFVMKKPTPLSEGNKGGSSVTTSPRIVKSKNKHINPMTDGSVTSIGW
jgi:two-component system response regulator PhoP